MLGGVALDAPCSGEHDEFARLLARDALSLAERPACPSCEAPVALHLEQRTAQGGLRGCLACGHPELFTRKDFPRAVGVGIVAMAAILVPFVPSDWAPYYPTLVAAALLDFVLFRFAPEVVECYVCEAEHRGFPREPRHPAFDRTIEERLKFGEQAVMGSPMRPGGTAGAPDPEH